jgi:hypothetical protein
MRQALPKYAVNFLKFIKNAQESSLKSALNDLVFRYKTESPRSGEILQKIKNLPGFLQLLEETALKYINTVHPEIEKHSAEDLSSKVMYYMWKRGIESSLETYDIRNESGVSSPYNWLLNRAKLSAKSAVFQYKQKNLAPKDALDNHLSYDELVNPHPKFVSDENTKMPPHIDYMAQDQYVDYVALLRTIQFKIKEIESNPNMNRSQFEELENLKQWEEDINLRNQIESKQKPNNPDLAQQSGQKSLGPVPASLMRRRKGQLISRDTADIDEVVTKANNRARYFQGSGQWVAENAFLPIYKLKQYQVEQNGRLPLHIIFRRAYEITDPQTARKIMEIMYESMLEAKLHADVAGRSNKEAGTKKLVNINMLQQDFLITLKNKLDEAGIKATTRDQIIARASRLDTKEWRSVLFGVDELLRHFQYNQIKKEQFGDKPWDKISDEEAQKIRDNAYNNLGYNNGTLMSLRRDDNTFGFLHNNAPEEERKKIMDIELQNWKSGKSDKSLVVRENASYPYFTKQKDEGMQTVSSSENICIRIAKVLDDMNRLAVFFEENGDFKSADFIDQSIRVASSIAAVKTI